MIEAASDARKKIAVATFPQDLDGEKCTYFMSKSMKDLTKSSADEIFKFQNKLNYNRKIYPNTYNLLPESAVRDLSVCVSPSH